MGVGGRARGDLGRSGVRADQARPFQATAAPSQNTSQDAGPSDASIDAAAVWPTAPTDAPLPDAGAPTFAPPDAATPPRQLRSAAGKTGCARRHDDLITLLQSSGGTRDAIVHVPASYDPTRGAMLVLSYHGFGSNSWEEELLTGMDAAADARGFIVVYPDGVASSWNAGTCCGTAWNDSVDDIQFTKDLLAKLEADYCVDASRVYATGMSNGGFFAHRLGCAMADVFAAIAPVAGVMGIDPAECQPSRPMPVIEFHGTADPVVPYNGGPGRLGPARSGAHVHVRSAEHRHMVRARTPARATRSSSMRRGDAACIEFVGCAGSSDVIQCTITGGGHTWPGGLPIPPLGKTSTDLSATDAMLDFFVAHPMPT